MAAKKPKRPRASNHVCLHYKAATYPTYCVFYASDCSVDPSRPCAYNGPCSLVPGGSCTSTSACQSTAFARGKNKHVHPQTKKGNSDYYGPGDSPETHNDVQVVFSILVKLKLPGNRTCRVKLFRLRKPGDDTMYIGIQVTDGTASETIDNVDIDEQCCRVKYNNRWYSVVLHEDTLAS